MRKIIAVVATIVIGYFGTALGGLIINWPQLGPISAVATMGVFILDAIENKRGK